MDRLGLALEVNTDAGKVSGSCEVFEGTIGAVVWFSPKPAPEEAEVLEKFLSRSRALSKIASFAGAFVQDGSVGLRFEDPAQAQAYVTRNGGILEVMLGASPTPTQYSLELLMLDGSRNASWNSAAAQGAPVTLPPADVAARSSYPASAAAGPSSAAPWAATMCNV